MAIKPILKPIGQGIEWLNAQPGRKRGIAAALLGLGTSLRVLGLEPYAQALEGFDNIVQGITTTTDIAGALMMVWGLIHPLVISHETAQIQAVNVLQKVQEKTPDGTLVKALQSEAIDSIKEAQKETLKADEAKKAEPQ